MQNQNIFALFVNSAYFMLPDLQCLVCFLENFIHS